MSVIRFVIGAAVGLVIAQVMLAVHTAVCGVPLLNLTMCFGLGQPAAWEQLLMTFGLPIYAGMQAVAVES